MLRTFVACTFLTGVAGKPPGVTLHGQLVSAEDLKSGKVTFTEKVFDIKLEHHGVKDASLEMMANYGCHPETDPGIHLKSKLDPKKVLWLLTKEDIDYVDEVEAGRRTF